MKTRGAPAHSIIILTEPVTVTVKTAVVQTVTTTTERAVPTMDEASVAGTGIVAYIVAVVVGCLAVGRRR